MKPKQEILELRDYFASCALQGVMRSPSIYGGADGNGYADFGKVAEASYKIADAMLAEKNK